MNRFLVLFFSLALLAFQVKKSLETKTIVTTRYNIDSIVIMHTSCNKLNDSADFVKYWKTFRQAVLNSDTNRLLLLTNFPIETRGDWDSDPTIEYSKKEFPKVFNLFLKQWAGDEAGSTEFDIIKSTDVPREQVYHGQIVLGDMVFFLINKHWKLNFLYLDYDTIDSIKLIKSTPTFYRHHLTK